MKRHNDPFRLLEQFLNQGTLTGDSSLEWGVHEQSLNGIHIDIAEDDTHVYITADLPGFEKDDIDLTVNPTTVEISAHSEERSEETTKDYAVQERRTEMSRRVTLPARVSHETAKAKHRNGVLSVTIEKETETDRTHIPVE